MIVVTGGAGFIGSNLVRALNARGRGDVVVVDDLREGRKFVNLVACEIADYFDRDEFLELLQSGVIARPEAIFHEGACAVTTEWDGRYMLENNYRYSVRLYEYCVANNVPLIYASSAAVYGSSKTFKEDDRAAERPLNVYGYSKLLFDQYVRRHAARAHAQVAGLRYFNVYGPGEAHKGPMASVAFHLRRQVVEQGEDRRSSITSRGPTRSSESQTARVPRAGPSGTGCSIGSRADAPPVIRAPPRHARLPARRLPLPGGPVGGLGGGL